MADNTKGVIGEQDFNKYDGVTNTFSRVTSTGGTVTLNKVGSDVDAVVTYGGGSAYTDATITAALTAIGTTNKVCLVLRPGTWVISANADWSAYTNVTFKFAPGAVISHGAYTVNIPNPEAGMCQILTGTGAVTFSGEAVNVRPQWYGAITDDSTSAVAIANALAIQYAIDTASAYGEGGGGTVDFSGGTFYVSRRVAYTYNGGTLYTILHIRGNVRYTGNGTIKIPDSFTTGGDYTFFAMENDHTAVDNIEFSNFTIDGNGYNNVVVDSGANVRRAYQIKLGTSRNVRIKNMRFINCPGRAAINAGYHATTDILYDVEIMGNQFVNMGRSITGNENQDDHSTIYLQADRAIVANNIFKNDRMTTGTNGLSAIEIHCSNAIIQGNYVEYYTHGGNTVGVAKAVRNVKWIGNTFRDLKAVGIYIYNTAGYSNLEILNNTFEFASEADGVTAATGIYMSTLAASSGARVNNLVIDGNIIAMPAIIATPRAGNGIQITAAKGLRITNNSVKNMTGDGIILSNVTDSAIDIEDVNISGNHTIDCGYFGSASVWGIKVINAHATAAFRNIKISNNTITRETTSAAVLAIRGIGLVGGGILSNVKVYGDNSFNDIASISNWIQQQSATYFYNVEVLPRVHAVALAADPTYGEWKQGEDIIYYTDPVHEGFIGKAVITSGAGHVADWGATTDYTRGQWVNISGAKVAECIVAGKSGGSAPTLTTLGEDVVDGTVTWRYRSSAAAAFLPFGNIP